MKHIYICPYNSFVECTRKPAEERCFACGHNPIEAARRKGYIEAGGMNIDEKGLYSLKLRSLSASM